MSELDPIFPPRPTALAQQFLTQVIREGDCVIDATAGNGFDTVFLARCVGESGRVLAFDIQESAIRSSQERVTQEGMANRVELFLKSHEQIGEHAAAGSISAVMFNLGYLPGEDHQITTETDGTIRALEAACDLLQTGGVLSVVCYPGHPAGAIEAGAVEEWMEKLNGRGWRVARYGAIGTKRPAPFLLLSFKMKV